MPYYYYRTVPGLTQEVRVSDQAVMTILFELKYFGGFTASDLKMCAYAFEC